MTHESAEPAKGGEGEGSTRMTIIREMPPRRHSGAGLWLVFALVGMAGVVALLLFVRTSQDTQAMNEPAPGTLDGPVEGATLAN